MKTLSILSLILFWVFSLGPPGSDLYASELLISQSSSSHNIGRHIRYYRDDSGKMGIDQIRQLDDSAWTQSESSIPTFGFTASTYWFQIKVNNELEQSISHLIESEYSHYDHIGIFVIQGEDIQHYDMGDLRPFSHRVIDYRNFLVPLTMAPQSQASIYMRIKTSGPLFLPVNIWQPFELFAERTKRDHIAGYYYGILIAMTGYNLFLFVTTRRRIFLYYILYTSGFFFFQFSLHGFGFHFLWPEHPWWANNCVAFFQVFALLWVTMFTIEFLETRANNPRLHKGLLFIAAMSILTIFLSLFASYSIAIRVGTVTALLGAVICLISGIVSLVRGIHSAYFYTIAFVCFLIGIMINALKQLGTIDQSFFTEYAIQFGSAAEMILLSIAIGHKIRVEQKKSHNAISELNHSLTKLNENLELRVYEKTQDIQSILREIPQGIFQIKRQDDQLIIDESTSQFLGTLTGTDDLSGKNPITDIFASTSLSSDQLSRVESFLETSLDEDQMQFDLNQHVLPTELDIQAKHIELDWSPILSEHDTVAKILVTMRDVTEIRKLQQKSIEEAKRYTKLGELAKHDSEKMLGFFTICQDLFNHCQRSLNLFPSSQALIFRNVHTIKGLARNFDLSFLTNQVHETEQLLRQDFSQDQELTDKLIAALEDCQRIFQEYRAINRDVLGREQSLEQVLVQRKDLQEIHDLLALAQTKEQIKAAENRILFLYEAKLQQLLRDEIQLLEGICKNLQKPLPDIVFVNDVYIIPNQFKSLLRKVFVHLLRNSLDHGIESPQERLSKSKSASGQITIELKEVDHDLIIDYYDDGRGLDLDKIKLRAEALHMKPADPAGPQELADLIFVAGFSTAEKVTDISGRGVGMDAIRAFLKEKNSEISLILGEPSNTSSANTYSFSFRLHLRLGQSQSTSKATG